MVINARLAAISGLIERGNQFTYQSFASSRNKHGYPNAYSDDWLVWMHEIQGIVTVIGAGSTPGREIDRGLKSNLLGATADDFQAARAQIVSGLKAAERIYNAGIPAADRTVSIGHNSPEQATALEKVDELIQAVEQSNDFPGDESDKQQVLAELSAARRILEASKIRLATLAATLKPPLKWVMEKAAGSIVGKIATAVYDYFTGLHWL